MRKKGTSVFFTLLLTGSLAAAAGTVPFPDYHAWTVIKNKLVGPQSPAYAIDGGMHHFYANAQAIEGYRTGSFPNGAVFVDERLDTHETAGVTLEGARRSVAVMRKDTQRYSDTGGWGYEVFAGDSGAPVASDQVKAACFTCHAKAKDQDYVHIEAPAVTTKAPAVAAGWNPRMAADYLDTRQKEWAAWKTAAAPGGACFSCHTNMTYLLARPALRAALGESAPTPLETAQLDGLRARVGAKQATEVFPAFSKEPVASQALGVEAVFSALFLAMADSGKPALSPAAAQAFDRLWALQIRDGKAAGAWPWFSLDLDPWETPDSPLYGAALAAVAVGSAPASYRARPEVSASVAALTSYLQRARDGQPLHNRLMLLWAEAELPGVLPAAAREALVSEIRAAQEPGGGWSPASLGPWKKRPNAPPSESANSYATAFVAFALEKGGVKASDSALQGALSWLRAHQDAAGFWEAASMNKRFEPGSMQVRFMRDAATAFAALALAENSRN